MCTECTSTFTMKYRSHILATVLLLSAGTIGYAEDKLPELTHRSNCIYSILEAAEYGNAEVMKARLAEGCDTNQRDEFGNTPLHLAAAGGHSSCIKLLLRHGADPIVADAQGRTPVQLAADEDSRTLCQKGARLRNAELELCRKVAAGDLKALKAVIGKKRFNPDMLAEDNQHTLLMMASMSGNAELVKLVLSAKPDINRRGPNGRTALHLACDTNNAETVKLLLEAGADPMATSNNNATALHDAVWDSRFESIKAILPAYKGVNFSPWGGHNGFPIGLAISRNNAQAVQLFVDAGFNPNDPQLFKESTPLHGAAQKDNAEMVKSLLEAGADKNATDKSGKRPRDYAGSNTASLL